MNLQQSTDFIYQRQIVVLALAKCSGEPNRQVLLFKREDVSLMETHILISKRKYDVDRDEFMRYLIIRDSLFPETPFLFPSKTGKQLSSGKFNHLLNRMLNKAKVLTHSKTCIRSSGVQISTLKKMDFQVKRPIYQKTLAVALLCYLALRPSEIAKLKKSDLDFDNRKYNLRMTKSQKDQYLPIPIDLYEPLLHYTANLSSANSFLFVNSIGNPWDRRDVHAAIRERGIQKGLTVKVTPRRLRPSVIRQLVRKKTSELILVKLLRHSDARTLHQNYLVDLQDELLDTMDNFHPDQPDAGDSVPGSTERGQ